MPTKEKEKEKEKKKGPGTRSPQDSCHKWVLKLHPYLGGGSNSEGGNEGQPSRPPELHARKGSGNTPPWESCKRVDSATPSIPTSFSKPLLPPQKYNWNKSRHPKLTGWGENLQGNQLPPPSTSQAFLHLPLLLARQACLEGGGGLLNFAEQKRARDGGSRESEPSRRQGGTEREREPGQSEGKEVQRMKERWAALGRPDRGNRPGMR